MDSNVQAKGMPGSAERRGERHGIAISLYLRGLAAVYLVAFVSLWAQLDGLVGERGILPASELMERVRVFGVEGWL